MKINHNMAAVMTNNQLLRTENSLSQTMERLSSGLKINHAKDDAAGMAISSKMQSQIDGLDQASRNASDGISVIETADGALNEVVNIIQRMRELSVQAANGTYTVDDKQAIQDEFNSLNEEIDRISRDTEFNTKPLLNGNLAYRVYASSSAVSRIQASDEVPEGDYKIAFSQQQKAATYTGKAVSAGNMGVSLSSNAFLKINGASVDLTGINASSTKEDIANAINAAAQTVNVDFSWSENAVSGTSKAVFTSTSQTVGAADSIQISASSEIAKYLGIPESTTVNGLEPGLNLLEGFSQTAETSIEDDRVTITDRNGFELSFYAEGGLPQNGEITFHSAKTGAMTLQIGAREHQTMDVTIPEVSTKSLYIDKLDVTQEGGPDEAMTALDEALTNIGSVRAKLGAYENRLDSATASLDQAQENLTSALSRISDADMAEEMTEYTKLNVLTQAATSVLAQANDQPQQVLQLLK